VWLLAYLHSLAGSAGAVEGGGLFVNFLLVLLSYFTYCQLWIPVVVKGLYDDFIRKKARVWAKTERFQVDS
jgi:hypothetical protein